MLVWLATPCKCRRPSLLASWFIISSQIFSHCSSLSRYFEGHDASHTSRNQDDRGSIGGVCQAFSPAFFFCSSCSSKSQRASRALTVRMRGVSAGWTGGADCNSLALHAGVREYPEPRLRLWWWFRVSRSEWCV